MLSLNGYPSLRRFEWIYSSIKFFSSWIGTEQIRIVSKTWSKWKKLIFGFWLEPELISFCFLEEAPDLLESSFGFRLKKFSFLSLRLPPVETNVSSTPTSTTLPPTMTTTTLPPTMTTTPATASTEKWLECWKPPKMSRAKNVWDERWKDDFVCFCVCVSIWGSCLWWRKLNWNKVELWNQPAFCITCSNTVYIKYFNPSTLSVRSHHYAEVPKYLCDTSWYKIWSKVW